jgi:hypothetical protein
MLRFYAPDLEPPLRHACVRGKEGIAIPARLEFAEGHVTARAVSKDAAAISLQVNAEEAGRLTLRTCLLPQRERPYLLPLELARHRIMLCYDKLESWRLTGLPETDPVMQSIETARSAFTRALCLRTPGADTYDEETVEAATHALALAVDASEQLTRGWADRAIAQRLNATADPPPTLGCVINTDRFTEPMHVALKRGFDFISCPLRWRDIEPEEGKFSFLKSDRWIEWAVRHGKLPVVAGPVLDFASSALPDWLGIWQHDYDTIREFAYEHAKRVVTRYRRTVTRWSAVSGLNLNDGFSFSTDQMIELTRLSVLLIRKLHPAAKVMVEIDQPFGEHGTTNPESIDPMVYAEIALDTGVAVDAFGLRLRFGGGGDDAQPVRDLMQLADVIDEFASLDRPLHITALGAPAGATTSTDGAWRGEWTPGHQAEWLDRALAICAAHPSVKSIAWHTLCDQPTRTGPCANGGLLDAKDHARPALETIVDRRAQWKRREHAPLA